MPDDESVFLLFLMSSDCLPLNLSNEAEDEGEYLKACLVAEVGG